MCFAKHQLNVTKVLKLALDSSSGEECSPLLVSLMQLLVNLSHKLEKAEAGCLQQHVLLYCLLNIQFKSKSEVIRNLAVKLFHNTAIFGDSSVPRTASNYGMVALLLRMLTSQQCSFLSMCDVLDALSWYVLAVPLADLDLLAAFVELDGAEALLHTLSVLDVAAHQAETVVLVLHALRKVVSSAMSESLWRTVSAFRGYLEELKSHPMEELWEASEVLLQILEDHAGLQTLSWQEL